MNQPIWKVILNWALVIAYTYIHYAYLGPLIYKLTGTRFISLGVWGIVVGVWGNLVGMRIVQAFYVSKDYRRENYFFVWGGIVLVLVGCVIKFL